MPATHPVGPQVRLKHLRLAHNLTQEQLAERIAEHGVTVTVSAISNAENGNRPVSRKLTDAWAKALGVDPLDVWVPEKASVA